MTEYENNAGSGFSGAGSVKLEDILNEATAAATRAERREAGRTSGVEDNIESSEAFYAGTESQEVSANDDFPVVDEVIEENYVDHYTADSPESTIADVSEELTADVDDLTGAIDEPDPLDELITHSSEDVTTEVEAVVETPEPVELIEPEVAPPTVEVETSSAIEEVAAPEPEPKPVPTPEQRVITPSSTVGSDAPNFSVETMERVIKVLENFRKLGDKEKKVAIQFMSNDKVREATEAEVILLALNADSMIAKTMKHLRDSYEMEPVDRAFHIMSLSEDELHSLGSLVSVFTNVNISEDLDTLSFGRALVSSIAGLDETAIAYVKGTESVLTAAQG